MSTSFIDRRLLLATTAAGLMVLSGCASKQLDTGLEGGGKHVSKYADQRDPLGDVASSDAIHIPPVPHAPSAEGPAQKAMPQYAQGLQAIRKGELDKALIMMQSLSAQYPQLSGPFVNQGLIYWKQENYADAQAVLEQALTVNASNPYAHNLLGLVLREQGKFVDARQHYEAALQLDPQYARAHFNLGVLAELYLQDLPLALNHFRAYQSLQKEPDQTVANWVIDLQRRAPAAAPPAALASPDVANPNQEVN
jgi:tetratricopeptide (TPR) repeat protein